MKQKLITGIIGLLVVGSAIFSVVAQPKKNTLPSQNISQQQSGLPSTPSVKEPVKDIRGVAKKKNAINPPPKKINPLAPTQNPSTTDTSPSKSYTLVQVAQHASQSSCWTAINGSVYDLSAWIAQHPGGEGAIVSICGKDGSDAFNNQHGGQGRPERALTSFIIGALKI